MYDSLTEKQARFVNGIVSGLNGSASARQAGYEGKNLDVLASRMLRNGKVREVIQERLKTKFDLSKSQFTATCWQEFIDSIDKSDRARFLDLTGRALGYLKSSSDNIQSIAIVNVEDLSKIKVTRSGDTIPVDTAPRVAGDTDTPVHTSSNPLPAIELQQPTAPENNVT